MQIRSKVHGKKQGAIQIYASGNHNNPDPSSGVGAARSLKGVFRQDTLVGALDFAEAVLPSHLSHHGSSCCSLAQAWFLNMDRGLHSRNRALPVWIHQRYQWGPSRWPLFWCEAVKADKLDCGAQSALTLEALAERGIPALPCQTIRKFDPRTISQWRASWERDGCAVEWAAGEYAYHETVAILLGNRLEVWDPSINAKVRLDVNPGYGSTVALRIKGTEHRSGDLMWGPLSVPLNRWVLINTNDMPGLSAIQPSSHASATAIARTLEQTGPLN